VIHPEWGIVLMSGILGRAAAMSLKDSLEVLKATLVRLAATGDEGVEGLMALILTAITGQRSAWRAPVPGRT